MRFDDSLKTVLAADTSSALGARAAYLQLCDLVARRRAPASPDLLQRLEQLRSRVTVDVRLSAARALALAEPPVELVTTLAADEASVAAAVLRAARLPAEAWEQVIAVVGPLGRSVLRTRRDLAPSSVRALEAFGTVDFALTDDREKQKPEEPAPVTIPQGDTKDAVDALVARLDHVSRGDGVSAGIAAFAFESDAGGVIRWVDTAPRGAVVGLSLRHDGEAAPSVDGAVAGAFRKRAPFRSGRLLIGGDGPLGGEWRVDGNPMFDRDNGRFVGFRGHARRPRIDEVAHVRTPEGRPAGTPHSDGLRRLVHELRTPTNAIAGFSELIEGEMLGPVAPVYRSQAGAIRRQVDDLIAAIDDIETAARIEADALDLRPESIRLAPLLLGVAAQLQPLAQRRGGTLSLDTSRGEAIVTADARVVERLFTRLLATLLSGTGAGETLSVAVAAIDGHVTTTIMLPPLFASMGGPALFRLDDEAPDGDAPLLGVGFALRLAQRLAGEIGGRMAVGADSLTVTLPSGWNRNMDQTSTRQP